MRTRFLKVKIQSSSPRWRHWDGTFLEATQSADAEAPFLKILPQFSTIIEIGFFQGGFSEWLYQNKKEESNLICYDITFGRKISENKKIDFRKGCCFAPPIKKEISELILGGGKTLVLCDGGNKTKEFNLYSSFLKPKDAIMCHDYAHSLPEFNRLKAAATWNFANESSYSQIKEAVKHHGLTPYMYEEFKSVFWGSFTKP